MIRHSILATVAVFAFTIFGCGQNGGWDGSYTYFAEYGSTAGGSPMFQEFTVTILKDKKCHISVNGYMTMDEIDCHIEVENSSVVLRFKSFEDGKKTNTFGVEIYKPSESLLKFERVEGNIVTHWLGLQTLDDKTPESGNLFQPTRNEQ